MDKQVERRGSDESDEPQSSLGKTGRINNLFNTALKIIAVLTLFFCIKIIANYFPRDSRTPDAVAREFARSLILGDVNRMKNTAIKKIHPDISLGVPLVKADDFNPNQLASCLVINSETIYKEALFYDQGTGLGSRLGFNKTGNDMMLYLKSTPKGWKIYYFTISGCMNNPLPCPPALLGAGTFIMDREIIENKNIRKHISYKNGDPFSSNCSCGSPEHNHSHSYDPAEFTAGRTLRFRKPGNRENPDKPVKD